MVAVPPSTMRRLGLVVIVAVAFAAIVMLGMLFAQGLEDDEQPDPSNGTEANESVGTLSTADSAGTPTPVEGVVWSSPAPDRRDTAIRSSVTVRRGSSVHPTSSPGL